MSLPAQNQEPRKGGRGKKGGQGGAGRHREAQRQGMRRQGKRRHREAREAEAQGGTEAEQVKEVLLSRRISCRG